MLKELRNLIGFLTIFPVGMSEDCLSDAADHMYLFPAVGVFIGLAAGLMAFLLSLFLPRLVVGFLSCGFLLLLTGLHHTDGLLDFGDGLMCHGPPERKIAAMHDVQTGTGGFILGLITVSATAACIVQINPGMLLQSLIVAEASAKFAMVVLARMGKSAHEGMNTFFVKAMHGVNGNLKFAASLSVSLIIGFLLLGFAGLLMIAAGFFTALVILTLSRRHFGGVTGDVMGAANELSRMSSLIALLILL